MTIASFRGERYFLSSMYPVKGGIETPGGLRVPCVETGLQVAKFVELVDRQKVLDTPDGFKAKKEAKKLRRAGRPMRAGWDEVKVDVMRDLVERKFLRNRALGELLLNTGDEQLIEGNGWNDNFWGASPADNPEGQNHLGIILMETRDLLRVNGFQEAAQEEHAIR